MPQSIRPWEPCQIPSELQSELLRRKTNRSFNYVPGTQGNWNDDTGDWSKVKGPMSPWIRFCSNGIGRQYQSDKNGDIAFDKNNNPIPLDSTQIKPGFVFFGGKDFYSGYGFSKNSIGTMQGIIGYTPDGTPHVIENDLKTSNYPIHVPAPEVEKITVRIQKELVRRANIDWVCFSKAQLEYMTPYFLVPGLTCILEWGWNHFNPASLLNLTNTKQLKILNNNPYPLYTNYILNSRGNYDVLFGKIINFSWRTEGNKIRCHTEIMSQDRIYAGLIVNSNTIDIQNVDGEDTSFNINDNLIQFINKSVPQLKSISSRSNLDKLSIDTLKIFNANFDNVDQLILFIQYLKNHHPHNKWKDYIYGIFYGRDMQDTKNDKIPYDNKKEDFDRKSSNKELWLNLGLVIEIINFFSAPIKSFNQAEIFRVDIDDCVITGHPNLISGDGTVLLIPNAESPKYFFGDYGYRYLTKEEQSSKDYIVMGNCPKIIPALKRLDAEKNGQLADYRLYRVCLPLAQNNGGNKVYQGARRDDIDQVINKIRYDQTANPKGTYAFPFLSDYPLDPPKGSKSFPKRYFGLLKNLYFNSKCLQDLVTNNDEVKTYPQLIRKIMDKISEATGNFWDLRLVSGTGSDDLAADKPTTMKIADYKMPASLNTGTPFSFDYMDADSLLLGMNFTPTLSYAQAIRTLYAPTNNPDKSTILVNGQNELLDYHFKDRLSQDEDIKYTQPKIRNTNPFNETMRELQQIAPIDGSYQMTIKDDNGKVLVLRLCLPSTDILNLLLDDEDLEHNPNYTGIMPGIQASFDIQGIGGLRTFMMFLVRNLPQPYSSQNIIFQIVDVQETIDASNWFTTITAGIRPLRGYIKQRLGIP